MSARDGGYNPAFSPRFAPGASDSIDAAEKGQADPNAQFTSLAGVMQPPQSKFTLSKAPAKSPKNAQRGFGNSSATSSPQTPVADIARQLEMENVNAHMEAAPGEQQYGAVPIPGQYSSPAVHSPTYLNYQGVAR